MSNKCNSNSVFPYPGGKGRESEWIVDRIPPHDTFIEVFGGSGAITYNKPPSKFEIYNDINDDLVQFFRVLRTQTDDLVEWLRNVPYSRSLYEEWVSAFYDGYRPDDPIERAGRYFTLRYMQVSGEASKPNGFKTRASRSPARTFDNARNSLGEVADRFSQVTIENRDYRHIFENYDDTSVQVVFYCDIPYDGTEGYYNHPFDRDDFFEALSDVDGEWMLSCGNLPTGDADTAVVDGEYNLRDEIEDAHVLERNRRHRMRQSESESDKTEYLICSFDPDTTSQFVDGGVEQTRLTQ